MSSNQIALPQGPRGKLIASVLKYGALIGVGWVIFPVIFMGIGGLIGLIIAAAIYMLAVALAPVVSLKIANFATKRLIKEIRENPVPSRMKVSNEMAEKLSAGEKELNEFNRSVGEYARSVEGLVSRYPAEATKFQTHLASMKKLLDLRYVGFVRAQKKKEEYDRATEKVRAIWEVTQASDKMNKAAGRMAEDDALTQIINDESIRAADEGMARSFADLDHLLRMEEISADADVKLPSGKVLETPVLEMAADGSYILPALTVKQKVYA